MAQAIRLSDVYKPHKMQKRFHEDPAPYRLYGGAKGGGKSVALLFEAISWCLRVPGCNVLLLRRTFPELKKGLIRLLELMVRSDIYGGTRNYNQSEHVVSFRNGSKLFFGSCQHEKDILSYQGHEYVFIGIDEGTEFTYEMWEFLTLQNRCPVRKDIYGNDVVPCMALATNPGGVGHVWVKALFIGELIDGKRVRTIETIKKRIPELKEADFKLSDYSFIPAKIFDNPTYATDEKYISKLKNANESWKNRYLYGSWEEFEGQYFEKFDEALTKIDTYVALRLVHSQPWHPKWISVDWGYNHHTAVFWMSKVTIQDKEGNKSEKVVVYREMVVQKVGERQLAEDIVKKCHYFNEDGSKMMENISNIYLSPDAWAKRGSENTVSEQLQAVLCAGRLPAPSPADDDRIGGARLMDEMLSRRPEPDLLISEDCEELLEAIPLLQVDDKEREKVKKVEGAKSDDVYDGCRYGLKSQLASGRTPWQVEREKALSQCRNGNEMLFTDLILQQKRKQGAGIRFQKPRFPYGHF